MTQVSTKGEWIQQVWYSLYNEILLSNEIEQSTDTQIQILSKSLC